MEPRFAERPRSPEGFALRQNEDALDLWIQKPTVTPIRKIRGLRFCRSC